MASALQAQGLAGLHQRGCGPLVFAIAVGPGLVVAAVYAEFRFDIK